MNMWSVIILIEWICSVIQHYDSGTITKMWYRTSFVLMHAYTALKIILWNVINHLSIHQWSPSGLEHTYSVQLSSAIFSHYDSHTINITTILILLEENSNFFIIFFGFVIYTELIKFECNRLFTSILQ